VAYMFSCGKIGARTADEVLVRVPLRLYSPGSTTTLESNAGAGSDTGDLAGVIKDLNATCHEYQREGVRRTVCRVESHCFLGAE
jgi:nuclear pore complex protein Nup85